MEHHDEKMWVSHIDFRDLPHLLVPFLLQVPRPAADAPTQPRVESRSPVDPIMAAAHHFHTLGFLTVIHDLQKKLNKKDEVYKAPGRWASGPKSWREANLGNCLQEFAKPGRNSISIITKESDIYAVDVDVKGGGQAALAQMLKEHGGFPDDTPREITGNGGLHFLFSLSQSAEAGLRSCACRTEIRYNGKKVGIDIRGMGGVLYTAPSSYVGVDGTLRCYKWDQEILPDRSNLRAIPEWLVSILNVGNKASDRGAEAPRAGTFR
jgi:hypothetical protein